MNITAKMTSYNEYISVIEVTWTPSTWWEKNITRLKTKHEKISAVGNYYYREDGDILIGFSTEEDHLYEVVFKAHLKGMREELQKIIA